MTDAKACGGVAQSDALVLLHEHCLRENAPAFARGVAMALTAGEAANPAGLITAGMAESEGEGYLNMALEFLRRFSTIGRIN